MEVQAKLKGVRLSAQKARLVADQIRGKGVEEALELLTFSSKKGAAIIKKVLNSAIANAEHNEGADVDELKISTICVDEGMTMKRIMPRAKGRADRILKRSCHSSLYISVHISPVQSAICRDKTHCDTQREGEARRREEEPRASTVPSTEMQD